MWFVMSDLFDYLQPYLYYVKLTAMNRFFCHLFFPGKQSLSVAGILRMLFPVLVFLSFFGCEKEQPLPDATVKVKLYDENWREVTDNSGVEVSLIRGDEKYQGVTDGRGELLFSRMPYGVFQVSLKKEGFVSYDIAPELTVHEDDSVDVHPFMMYQVPGFTVAFDSLWLAPNNRERFYGSGKFLRYNGPPLIQYNAIVYFGTDSNVSKDNYLFLHYGAIIIHYITGDRFTIWITNWVNQFLVPAGYDKLYVRVYPVAPYHDWITIRNEALGTPSEVFEWRVPR